jgi:uncharacterized protein (TIGR02466 family)
MQNSGKLQAIFPTLIFFKKFNGDLFDKIQQEISPAVTGTDLGRPWPEAIETSFRFKGYNNVIDQFNMETFKNTILETATEYLESIPTKVIPKLYIESNWVAKSAPNGSMHSHTHPFSFISGVYYFRTEGTEGNLVFENPNAVVDWEDPYGDIWPNNYFVQPSEGMMVMFPSWLRHRVDLNTTSNNRWCLSFNIYKTS